MFRRSYARVYARAAAILFGLFTAATAHANTVHVAAGGDLQAALNAALPGDTILLTPGATYVGNFRLPVHGGTTYVTLRTADPDALLPGAEARISPSHASALARLQSPNTMPALTAQAGASYWRVMLVAFGPNKNGGGDIVALGASSQTSLAQVPHHLIFDRVLIQGDPSVGQKRGIALNSAETTIVNSHISDIKAIAQDTQAIAGWNGPGPFHIENNYLEAAGNVFILGGDDPKISGLVPSDLVFTRNLVTRPVAWRDPIVPAPVGVAAMAGTGGSLAAGTYSYRVVARRPAGTTTATSTRSVEVAATVGANGSVTIRWNPVPNATEYRVYGRTAGAQNVYWTVADTSFTDTGAAGTAGTPPASGTVWQVKNLFELKNTRRARIDYNLLENNWQAAQSGIAILFTVRNQYGGCLWCVVEDVTFEYNTVRSVAAGINILGIDPNFPSQQTNAIRIRHNEFADVNKAVWGGSGFFLQMGDTPRDIIVDHNTFVSPSGSSVVTVGGPPIFGFVFTNNVARHNTYGIAGSGYGYGNSAIAYYFPDGVIRRNVFAGGRASMYPSDNFFPTVSDFEGHFADYAGGNFALIPGTDWEGAGTDGQDLGANIVPVQTTPAPRIELPQVLTESLPGAHELEPYGATLDVSGGMAPYEWSLLDGVLPDGLTLDPLTGIISGVPTVAGDFAVIVQVSDTDGATAAQPLSLHVERAIPPVQIVTEAIATGVASAVYAQHLDAVGGSGAYTWDLASGALPSGVTLSSTGALSGVPAVAGAWTFDVAAHDTQDPLRRAIRTFVLTVAPPLNRPPKVTVSTNVTDIAQVGAPVIITADTSDSDGFVQRVDFFVNGQPAGSVSSAPFTLEWIARDGGPHVVTATAVDDDGAEAASAPAVVQITAEIVIYASDVQVMQGDFQLVNDASAAGGRRLWNPNRNVARVAASPTPANYAEFTFYAEAGRAYHLWMRGLAEKNDYNNDSFSVQFSGTVDARGVAVTRIGTAEATSVIIEDGGGAHVFGWGWQDNAYGGFAQPIYFEQTGLQTVRVQQREDGLSIDQIVISPTRYLTTSPGLLKSDTTLVPR